MSKVLQTKDELEQHLREQVSFIKRSADAYDQGHKAEAKRLALAIRVLVHDTQHSTSLLRQLGLKGIPFLDTSTGVDTSDMLYPHGLVGLSSVKGHNDGTFEGGEYVPLCSLNGPRVTPKWVDFDQWWNDPVILLVVDDSYIKPTRRDVVLTLANQQGGGHVDSMLNEEYSKIDQSAGLSFVFGNKETHVKEYFRPVDLASVRQIAHEVLSSLDNSCPEFF